MKFIKFCDSIQPADEEATIFLIDAAEGQEFLVKQILDQRTSKQNAAIHAFLRELGGTLTNHGYDFRAFPFKEGFEAPWTVDLAKEYLWLPVQKALALGERTSDLKTHEVDMVYQPLAKKISELGVACPPLGRF